MKTLLIVDSSGRVTRSNTRQLTRRFAEAWREHAPEGNILVRDVGLTPPSTVNEAWIAAAFTDETSRTAPMHEALRESETLIAELEAADAVVFGAPIYNFGLPAQLKAYFDQVVRVHRTFAFSAGAENPYTPLLRSKPVVVIESAGDGSLYPGGHLAHLNFLEPQITTMLGFVGLTDVTFVRVGYDEFQDERLHRSFNSAEREVDAWMARHFQRIAA
jgi:FMN-dependent NADH-azoreductase